MRASTLFLGLLPACVTSTGGERVTFHAVAVSEVATTDAAPIVWTDADTGWTVTLTEAQVHLGPLYAWSEQPRLDTSALGALWSLVVPTAQAFDQFAAGFLRAEVTTQVPVDLLSPDPTEVGEGVAQAGPSRSAELWLEPVSGGDTLSFAGVATRDGLVVPFRGGMTIDEDWVAEGQENPQLLRRLRGLLWEAELAQGGTMTVHVDPRRWFDGAPFDTLLSEPPDADGAHVVGPDTAVGRNLYALARRIGSTGPWRLEWTANNQEMPP